MPTVFEQYAPYRPAVTAEERETLDEARRNQDTILADPDVRRWEWGWLDGEGRLAPYPLQQNQIQIALDRARSQLRLWGMDPALFPVERGTTACFPGVDPKGKGCEVDMAFAQRGARLEAALSSRPPEVRAYVERQLKDMSNRDTPMGDAWANMKYECYDIRTVTLAARLAVTEETSQWLLEDARARKGKSAITKVDGVLNVLEYLSGLTDRKPTPQERALMAELKAPVATGAEHHRSDSLTAPQSIAVEFEDFDHQVQQEFFHAPTQLQAEKQAAGKVVMERLLAGDTDWAAETLLQGQEHLLADIDRLTTDMDFSDDRQILNSANRPLFFAASTAFDASQEERHCREAVNAAAERLYPGRGKEAYDRMTSGVNATSAFFSAAHLSLGHINDLSVGSVHKIEADLTIDCILSYAAAKQVLAKKRAAVPGRPMSRHMGLNGMPECYAYGCLVKSKEREALVDLVKQGGAAQCSVGREAQCGRLQARFRIRTDPNMEELDFHLAPPARQAAKEES